VKAGTGFLEVCPEKRCDGLLRAHPAPDRRTGRQRLFEVVMRPFSKEGVITALALAVPAYVGLWFGILLTLIYAGAMVAFYFGIIRHVAAGRPGLPGPPDSADDLGSMLGHALQALLIVGVGGLPFVLAGLLGGTADSEGGRLLLVLALTGIGFLWLPAAILGVALTGRTLAAVWPLTWAAVIRRAPAAYLRLCGLFAATTVGMLVAVMGAELFLGQIPYVGVLLAVALSNLLLFAQACLVGGFLLQEHLAYGYA